MRERGSRRFERDDAWGSVTRLGRSNVVGRGDVSVRVARNVFPRGSRRGFLFPQLAVRGLEKNECEYQTTWEPGPD